MDKTLDLELKSLSLRQLLSDSHLEKKREMADMLFELLRKKTRYYRVEKSMSTTARKNGGYVDRCYITGSTGKRTDVETTFDLDLVIFVNEREPPFDKVFRDFAFIIKRLAKAKNDYKLDYLWIRRSLNAIELKLNDFGIHIYPAPNYVNHCSQKPKIKELSTWQANYIFEKIKDHPKLARSLRSGLCETHLEFLRANTSSTIHELIRLCKYWDKQIRVTGYIEDRSTLIELIAVKAGQEFQTILLKGLENFLNFMENFQKLQIKFDFDPLAEMGPRKTKITTVAERQPFVMDPANPFYNVANGVTKVQIKQFSEAAIETKSRLEQWRQGQLKKVEEIFEQKQK